MHRETNNGNARSSLIASGRKFHVSLVSREDPSVQNQGKDRQRERERDTTARHNVAVSCQTVAGIINLMHVRESPKRETSHIRRNIFSPFLMCASEKSQRWKLRVGRSKPRETRSALEKVEILECISRCRNTRRRNIVEYISRTYTYAT